MQAASLVTPATGEMDFDLLEPKQVAGPQKAGPRQSRFVCEWLVHGLSLLLAAGLFALKGT
jgi:hypothetical protein